MCLVHLTSQRQEDSWPPFAPGPRPGLPERGPLQGRQLRDAAALASRYLRLARELESHLRGAILQSPDVSYAEPWDMVGTRVWIQLRLSRLG